MLIPAAKTEALISDSRFAIFAFTPSDFNANSDSISESRALISEVLFLESDQIPLCIKICQLIKFFCNFHRYSFRRGQHPPPPPACLGGEVMRFQPWPSGSA